MNVIRVCATLALLPFVGCASNAEPRANERENEHAVRSPIIGGYLDTMTKGVVALTVRDGTQVQVFCSGSLIAPNLVLTARHCTAQLGDGTSEQVDCSTTQFTGEFDPRTLFVSTDAQPQTSNGKLYSVDQVLAAPGGNNACGFDVALLILSGAGVPSTSATPLVPELSAVTQVDATFSALGYGLQRAGDTDGTTAGSRMRFDGAQVYCVGSSCAANAANAADEWVGNSPVCSGDSGGPALSASGRVFGVTSRGPADCSYALYSNVADWADFIRSTAGLAATAGGYPAPAWAAPSTSAPSDDAGASTNAPDASSAGAPSSSAGSLGNTSASAGAGTATPPPVSGATPTVDPLGQQCSGSCPGSYQCFSAKGTPPGICVPPCAASGASCPQTYTCADSLKVCVPEKDIVSTSHASASCAVGVAGVPTRGPGAAAWLVALGVAWVSQRRRRSR